MGLRRKGPLYALEERGADSVQALSGTLHASARGLGQGSGGCAGLVALEDKGSVSVAELREAAFESIASIVEFVGHFLGFRGQCLDEFGPEDASLPGRIFTIFEDFEVGHAAGPAFERGSGLVLVKLLPEDDVGFLEDFFCIGGILDKAECVEEDLALAPAEESDKKLALLARISIWITHRRDSHRRTTTRRLAHVRRGNRILA